MILRITLKHLFSKPMSTLLTVFAVAVSLGLLGAFWTIVENLDRVRVNSATTASDSRPGITLFIDAKSSPSEVTALKQKLLEDKRFSSVDLVPAAEALKALEQQFGETLSKVFGSDSLPITMKVRLTNAQLSREEWMIMLNHLRALPGVLDVDDGAAVVPAQETSVSTRIFSWATGLLIIVFLTVALLVSHLIRLAFESLRGEVETMKVLGASNFWILSPILLEGLAIGVAGALLALVFLGFSVQVVLPKFSAVLLPKGASVQSLSFLSSAGLCGLALFASVLGALFTWPLVRRPAREL